MKDYLGFIELSPNATTVFDKLMVQSSWGCKKVKDAIGLDINKSNMSSVNILKYYVRTTMDMCYESLSTILDELSNTCNGFKTNMNPKDVQDYLKSVWSKHKDCISYEEKKALRYMIVSLGLYCSTKDSIGRNDYELKLFEYASHVATTYNFS